MPTTKYSTGRSDKEERRRRRSKDGGGGQMPFLKFLPLNSDSVQLERLPLLGGRMLTPDQQDQLVTRSHKNDLKG